MSANPKPKPPLGGMKGMSAVQAWNQMVPVGTPVKVHLDDGSLKDSKTESEAWMLGGHTAVIQLEGISGAYSLARVRVAKRILEAGI
jgi:hypothetical protein